MYTPPVKRLQIYIDEELDEILGVEAARRKTSKAALIRDAVRKRFGGRRADPIDALVGDIDEEPGDIDEVVYGA